MKTLQCDAIVTGIRAKVDHSLGLTISTPELSNNEKALFMEMQGINTRMTIEPLDEKAEGVEKIDKEVSTKTQSQRLRAVIYVYWEQQGKNGTFEEFYRAKTEKLIDFIKGKLEQ